MKLGRVAKGRKAAIARNAAFRSQSNNRGSLQEAKPSSANSKLLSRHTRKHNARVVRLVRRRVAEYERRKCFLFDVAGKLETLYTPGRECRANREAPTSRLWKVINPREKSLPFLSDPFAVGVSVFCLPFFFVIFFRGSRGLVLIQRNLSHATSEILGYTVMLRASNPGTPFPTDGASPDEVVLLGGYRRHRLTLELSPPPNGAPIPLALLGLGGQCICTG